MSKAMLKQRLDTARWQFFADTGIGHNLTRAADRLHERFPKSKLLSRAWAFCLPF